MTYENMSVEQLEKENQKLMQKRVDIKTEQLKIVAILEKKVDEKKVKEKIDSMTDKEKKIAVQVLGEAGGIKSEEKVGEPGV